MFKYRFAALSASPAAPSDTLPTTFMSRYRYACRCTAAEYCPAMREQKNTLRRQGNRLASRACKNDRTAPQDLYSLLCTKTLFIHRKVCMHSKMECPGISETNCSLPETLTDFIKGRKLPAGSVLLGRRQVLPGACPLSWRPRPRASVCRHSSPPPPASVLRPRAPAHTMPVWPKVYLQHLL